MTIPRISEFIFRFRDGKGIRTDQLWGEFVKKINTDGSVVVQNDDGTESTINPIPDQRVLIGNANPSADTDNAIVLRNEEAYLTELGTTHEATPSTAAFVDYNHANYLGALSTDPDPNSYLEGQWYFNYLSHSARINANVTPLSATPTLSFVDANLVNLIAGNGVYQREWPSDIVAARHIVRIGDFYFNTANYALRIATAYVAGTGKVEGRKFKRIATDEDLAGIVSTPGHTRVFHTTGGTASAIVLTSEPHEVITSYTDDLIIAFKTQHDVPANTTINVDGVGAVNLREEDQSNIEDGMLKAGVWVIAVYNKIGNAFDILNLRRLLGNRARHIVPDTTEEAGDAEQAARADHNHALKVAIEDIGWGGDNTDILQFSTARRRQIEKIDNYPDSPSDAQVNGQNIIFNENYIRHADGDGRSAAAIALGDFNFDNRGPNPAAGSHSSTSIRIKLYINDEEAARLNVITGRTLHLYVASGGLVPLNVPLNGIWNGIVSSVGYEKVLEDSQTVATINFHTDDISFGEGGAAAFPAVGSTFTFAIESSLHQVIAELVSHITGNFTQADILRLLPTLPAEGSRNGKIAKFVADVLTWVEETGSGSRPSVDSNFFQYTDAEVLTFATAFIEQVTRFGQNINDLSDKVDALQEATAEGTGTSFYRTSHLPVEMDEGQAYYLTEGHALPTKNALAGFNAVRSDDNHFTGVAIASTPNVATFVPTSIPYIFNDIRVRALYQRISYAAGGPVPDAAEIERRQQELSKIYIVLDDGVTTAADELWLYISHKDSNNREVGVYNLPLTLENSGDGVRVYYAQKNEDLIRYLALAVNGVSFGIRRGTEWLAATAVADGIGNALLWIPGEAPVLPGLYTGPEEPGDPYRAQLVPYGTKFDNRDFDSQPFTPRRVSVIPSNMLENDIVALMQDTKHPTNDHLWHLPIYGAQPDSGPTAYSYGFGLANTVPNIPGGLGADETVDTIFGADGIRALYSRGQDRNHLFMLVARAVISDADAASITSGSKALSIHLISNNNDGGSIPNDDFTANADQITSTAATRLIRFPINSIWASFGNNIRSPNEDGYSFSAQLDGNFLHIDSGNVRFTGEGQDRGAGLYLGLEDGGHRAVTLGGAWRELTGASPYTVQEYDQEFMVVVTHTDGSNVTYLEKIIPKVLLTTNVRRFGVVESNAASDDFNGIIFINANINAVGTELTTSLSDRAVNNEGFIRYAIVNVYAR